MMSVKMGPPGLLKIGEFRKKGYDVITFVCDVTSRFYCITDVVMGPKFGNYSISMRKVIITSI